MRPIRKDQTLYVPKVVFGTAPLSDGRKISAKDKNTRLVGVMFVYSNKKNAIKVSKDIIEMIVEKE
jgi:hypothetical protein